MEYFSTTSLAIDLGVEPSELFEKLRGLGLIEREYDKWRLTNLGKQIAGQMTFLNLQTTRDIKKC